MKIRVISSKEEISTIDKNEVIVHLTFRPSNTDIFTLFKKCPNLEAIQIPNSYIRTTSRSTLMFLEMNNIATLQGDIWGHRKDINEYYEIKPAIFSMIKDLKKEGKSDEYILEKLSIETRLSEDLIKLLLTENVK